MAKPDKSAEGNVSAGNNAMTGIDGAKVRRLRESQGLTQLYLATVIGVTTDTISRWENKRYPAIKPENAEKLAKALEVDLEELFARTGQEGEQGEKTGSDLGGDPQVGEGEAKGVDDAPVRAVTGQEEPPAGALPFGQRFKIPALLFAVVVVVSLAALLWFTLPGAHEPAVSVQRILPPHVPAGQLFPVLIRVTPGEAAPISLILREVLPRGCTVMSRDPAVTGMDNDQGVLKWIRRIEAAETSFIYTVRAPADAAENALLTFSGSLVLKQGKRVKAAIGGAHTVRIAPFHWADRNRDSRVDDEEILAVYDIYGEEQRVDFNRNLIDDIWAGHGYRWDMKTEKYIVEE